MGERFEDLSRAVGAAQSRRSVLKLFGAAAAAAVGTTLLRPFRAGAACPAGQTPCGETCCPSGVTCLSPGKCGCPPGVQTCGSTCCGSRETCSDPTTGCCCPSGTTPCGSACCAAGVACVDKAHSICGCPAGYTVCGTGANTRCCAAGKPCTDASCQPVSNFTGANRLTKTCVNGTCTTFNSAFGVCQGQDFCGSSFCFCNANVTNGVPNGSTFCTVPTDCENQNCQSNSDCPSGQVCQATCCDQPKCFAICSSSTATQATSGTPSSAPSR